LLQQGGFLVFIDGLNEVDKTTRRSVHHFVEQYSGTNYFCISSQLVDSDVETPKKVKLARLSDGKVRELLRRKLGPEKAATALEQFSEATYDLCRVPQHLEFVVELLEREGTVPGSRSELFGQMLAPVMESWVEQDRKVFCEALTKRAYEMLCTVDPVFDRQGEMPAGISGPLRELRFLVPRGDDRLEFQHDTVRDFLAAKYFALRWEALLKGEPDIDLGWLSMLEFVILGIDDFGQAKEMLLDILERNSQFAFAKGLYQFTKQNRPDLFGHLGRDFFPQYVARSMLEAA
jgi:hypothetical protein